MIQRRAFVASSLSAAAVLAALPLRAAFAQSPAPGAGRPIRLVVGYPAGGTADALARIYAEELGKRLGGPVVVDNRPGAGGQLAAEQFRSAPSDGSTLLLANSHMMTTLPLTSRSVKYDPMKDFAPVARMATFELALAVSAGLPAKTFEEYLALAKAQPEQRNFGIPAAGSGPHFAGYLVGKKRGIDLQPVPYKGGAPLLADLIGGHIPAAVDALGGLLEPHRAGKLRILAVTGPQRAAGLPDVPTFSQLGFAELTSSNWVGLFAPLGLPPAQVQQIEKAVAEVAALPAVAAKLPGIGFAPGASTAQQLREVVRNDLALWQPVIAQSGFKMD
jgi:tripartite-type tricarboxylate transporter receptor subunit TctC